MKHSDYCVVGGGIVRLATAYQLLQKDPGASLVLLEAADRLTSHQTKDFCREHGPPYREPGKLRAA